VSSEEKGHLNPEELVTSAVAEEDLSPSARRHLEACPECGRQRDLILEDLRNLGWSARRFAPEPVRKITLPAREPVRGPARPYGWALGLGLAAAAAALVLMVWPWHPGGLPGVQPLSISWTEAAEDERLMAEVSRLEEDALPDQYREISPEGPAAAVDDDETIDFVVPVDDDGGLT
jgi:hypothetical protein